MSRSQLPGATGPGRGAAVPPGESRAADDELAELRAQLGETRATIEAIRGGGVDSLVIGPPGQEQVYALASADRTYRLIVEAMNEGAVTISPRGIILDANPRFASMTGQDGTRLVGTALLDLVSGAHRDSTKRLLAVGVGDSNRGEVELTGCGGATVPVLLAVSGFDLDGMLLRSLVLTDLSAQRHAEAEVRALNTGLEARVKERTAELELANENLESFSYSVSHDLRAPLRSLSGFSDALVEEYSEQLDDTARGYIGRIRAASDRMATLIDDLLQLARVSRAEMNLSSVDLSAEVAAIATELQSREPGRHVAFSIQGGIRATADRTLIRTVLQNLIENAWKFTARCDEGAIEFGTTDAEGAAICCYVRDNGAGFDSAYDGKLFQPFQRLHAATDFPGTGIGLASVRRIVGRHGGRTWAHGAVGEGASFYFTLDAKNIAEPEASSAGEPKAATASKLAGI